MKLKVNLRSKWHVAGAWAMQPGRSAVRGPKGKANVKGKGKGKGKAKGKAKAKTKPKPNPTVRS